MVANYAAWWKTRGLENFHKYKMRDLSGEEEGRYFKLEYELKIYDIDQTRCYGQSEEKKANKSYEKDVKACYMV